ncbi:chloroplast protein FOR GROWTH AND FERTILITY 2-like [Syzygium oleosum]|uniref:chloroplast protein FOR GROWTH AND FERTILITY 2-like n=1 Tax=Syzygium oleosum TaxID=219896 RepID=UPI0011D1FEE5|nr:chloroplast protein FOR GROWTH AND FERTILITY 2-like [Syzygium oleosum]
MERLIYSSSPSLPSRIHRRAPSPSLRRLGRLGPPWLGLSSPARRLMGPTISCHVGKSPPSPSLPSRPLDGSPSPSIRSPEEPPPTAIGDSQKLKGLTAGTFVLLSALIVALIHPFFASPAFATFQSAAKTGGPASAAAVGTRLIRTELLSSAWTGFFAGCLHTLSGPDHLAALAPLSIGRTRMESAAVGALWGCGHDAGQVLFGLLFLLLKDRLHIEIIRTWGTRVVGFTLLVIGAMGIREASEVPTPCVALENGECDVSLYETLENPKLGKKKKIGFATFATGIVHGLQPDALMMVLPALALPSRLAGAAFLLMFLVGTVFAMGSYTVFIGSCSQALKERVPRITEKLTWASSLVAIALGLAIIVSQFFGYSLY